jgi:L-fucose mutarotase
MIKTDIIHPELLMALAETGHGARILLADSNYPVTTKAAMGARRVFLNFIPGIVGGVDIIRALAATIPVESAIYMANAEGKMPEIVAEYQKILGSGVPFEDRERFAFYDEAVDDDTALVIASGEQRVYANLLITVGVRK